MTKLKNILIGTAIGAGVFGLVAYVKRLLLTEGELLSEVSGSMARLNGGVIEIKLEVLLKNPTDGSLVIEFPFVKVYHGNAHLLTSEIKHKRIEIRPHNQAKISDMVFTLKPNNLLSLLKIINGPLQKAKTITLDIDIISTIYLAVKNVPYKTTKKLTLTPFNKKTT